MGLLWPKCKIQQRALLNLIHLASINSSCSHPSLEPFCLLADQHSHATWCHLQTDWGCIWSPNPDNWYKYLTGLGPVLSPGEHQLWPAANWIIKNSIHQSLGLAIQTFFAQKRVYHSKPWAASYQKDIEEQFSSKIQISYQVNYCGLEEAWDLLLD